MYAFTRLVMEKEKRMETAVSSVVNKIRSMLMPSTPRW